MTREVEILRSEQAEYKTVELKNAPLWTHDADVDQASMQPWRRDATAVSLDAHKVLTVEEQLGRGMVQEAAGRTAVIT